MTAPTEAYSVQLDGLFEGPMDLLVHLIKKNEVDIYDIPIATITDQYLATIELLQALNVELAGEFLVMAATLVQIKSRLLLPIHDDEEDDDDPRSEITRPLLEYLEIKAAAEALANRHLLGEDTFVRSKVNPSEIPVADDEEVIRVGLFELIDAFQRILERMAPDHRVDMTSERVTVKDRINQLIDLLEERASITFDELFQSDASRGDMIVTFLAILEMVKLQLIRVAQHIQSGVIRLFYQ